MEQGAQSGGRIVDQGLLVAVIDFITHRGDEGARLPLAAGAGLAVLEAGAALELPAAGAGLGLLAAGGGLGLLANGL